MKKYFQLPELEVGYIEVEDVITTSCNADGIDLPEEEI